MKMRGVAGSAWLAAMVLVGCGFSRSEHPDFDGCKEDGDCGAGQECVQGFCVEEGSGRADGGGGGSGGSGQTGGECENTRPEPCYEAEDSSTEDVGVCRGGERQCVAGVFTQCLGQVLPIEEDDCNGEDDDCDGMTDEFPAATCPTPMSGVCAQGSFTCFEGVALCQPNEPLAETCNGEDDDCDSEVDEGQEAECYPSSQSGCTTTAEGFTMCVGLCSPGTRACSSGTISCEDATVPVAEACTSGGGRAVDEDCDGQIDEGSCPCILSTMRECYAGPEGTLGRGACRAGTQTCTGLVWSGDCPGQVLPAPETCDNSGADNDCNGEVDDIPGLGGDCIDESKKGICRFGEIACGEDSAQPMCVTPGPQTELCDDVDQDCDGDPANGFDFNSDATCGSCDVSCDGNVERCCGGLCVPTQAFQEDEANCGACGARCGTGQFCCQGKCINGPINDPGIPGGQIVLPPPNGGELCACSTDCGQLSCCYTDCVDLDNDPKNCGGCGNDCTSGGSLDIVCVRGQCTP